MSLPRSKMEVMIEQGSKTGKLLKQMKENIDRPLAAILTINTVAHTVGATGVGAQAAVIFGNAAVGIASAIMTLAILVVSEIIPKTLGAVHAASLASITAYATRIMIFICFPLIILLEKINHLIGYQRHKDLITRAEVLATIRLGWKGGTLRAREHRIVSNVLALGKITLKQIRTPRTVLFSLPQDMTVKEMVETYQPIPFSRIPIYGESTEDIKGYVLRADLYEALASGKGDVKLAVLKKPIIYFPELTTVATAIEQMLKQDQHIAIVVDEFGGIEGIVSLEDMLETLLGQEIVDERDEVADMQDLARRIASKRR